MEYWICKIAMSDARLDPDIPACLTAGCRFAGNIQWGNYCSQCYKNRNERELNQLDFLDLDVAADDRVYPELVDDMNTITLREQGLVKCSICLEFYGRLEQGGVCDDCFSQMSAEPDIKNKPGKCKKCAKFFGSPELAGYCNSCFMKMTQDDTKKNTPIREDVRPVNRTHNNSVPMTPVQPHPLGFDRISSPPLAPVISDQPIIVDIPSQAPHPHAQQFYGNASAPYSSLRQQQIPVDPPSYTAVMSHNPLPPPPVNPFPPPDPSPPSNPPPRPAPPRPKSSPPVPKPRRSAQTATVQLVETCFVCDSGKQIALTNMICQQHAIQVREMFRRKEGVADSSSNSGRGMEGGDRVLRGWDGGPNPVVQLPAPTDSRQGLFNIVNQSPDIHGVRNIHGETAFCHTPGCPFYGKQECKGYCHNCYYYPR